MRSKVAVVEAVLDGLHYRFRDAVLFYRGMHEAQDACTFPHWRRSPGRRCERVVTEEHRLKGLAVVLLLMVREELCSFPVDEFRDPVLCHVETKVSGKLRSF